MPLTSEQSAKLKVAFRPHAPIVDPDAFVGRADERSRVEEAIEEPGLQVVVYGERGCGKTSLANVATSSFTRLQVFCERDADFHQIAHDIALKYQEKEPEKIVYDAGSDTLRIAGTTLLVSQLTGNMLLRILPREEQLVVVLDEMDRVEDLDAIRQVAELVKNVSTYHQNLTFILVGVADTADELLSGHASNFRNLRQMPLTRMVHYELRGILAHGGEVLNLEFSSAIMDRLVEICDRMPYYLHLLATNAARSALDRDSEKVGKHDLAAAARRSAGDADQELREIYERAILSSKGSEIYRRIVWAMASEDGIDFNVARITQLTNQIASAEEDSPVTPQAVGQALGKLSSDEKKKIVSSRISGVYRFTEPLMKGFVRVVRAQP